VCEADKLSVQLIHIYLHFSPYVDCTGRWAQYRSTWRVFLQRAQSPEGYRPAFAQPRAQRKEARADGLAPKKEDGEKEEEEERNKEEEEE